MYSLCTQLYVSLIKSKNSINYFVVVFEGGVVNVHYLYILTLQFSLSYLLLNIFMHLSYTHFVV